MRRLVCCVTQVDHPLEPISAGETRTAFDVVVVTIDRNAPGDREVSECECPRQRAVVRDCETMLGS